MANIASILLTGATGFLGIFLLREILEQFPTSRVFCLLRGDADVGKLEATMQEGLIWKDEYKQRIEIVQGDISLPFLGLEDAKFLELAQTIDAIFHCGAAVNSVIPYNVIKKANVGGTREIIRLALFKKRKYLFHISTLSVLDVHDGNGALNEIPMKALITKLNNASGYSQSKFVADMLVRQAAVKYQLPVLIFRPTTISGDTQSGYSNIRDSVNIIASGIAELGVAPILACEFDMVPVDSAAKAIVHISKKGKFDTNVYHLTNPKDGTSLGQIIQALETIGFQIKKVDFEEWLQAISTIPNHPLYTLLPSIERGMGGLTNVNETNSTQAWTKEVPCAAINEEVLIKCIRWLAKKI